MLCNNEKLVDNIHKKNKENEELNDCINKLNKDEEMKEEWEEVVKTHQKTRKMFQESYLTWLLVPKKIAKSKKDNKKEDSDFKDIS